MNDENPHPELKLHRDEASSDEYSLPGPLVAQLKREFTDPDSECPAWVTVAMATAYERQRAVMNGRRRALRFAVVAACISIVAVVGMRMNRGSSTLETESETTSPRMSKNDAKSPSGSYGGLIVGAEISASGKNVVGGGGGGGGGHLVQAASRDINRDGAVNILDAMKLARAVVDQDTSLKLAGNLKFDKLTLDVSWDLTGDGRVDQADVDALALLAVEGGAS